MGSVLPHKFANIWYRHLCSFYCIVLGVQDVLYFLEMCGVSTIFASTYIYFWDSVGQELFGFFFKLCHYLLPATQV